MRKTAIVSGYATVDYPARLPRPLCGAQTSTIEALSGDHWPRAGGAALYASRRIAAAGHCAGALVTVGQDLNGELYLEACRSARLHVETITRSAGVRTPWCVLLYHDEGSYTCLIDRGDVDQRPPPESHLSSVACADLVCIAAGSARTSMAVLETVPANVPLAWIAKRDPVAFPAWLALKLGQRADLIFCNASERPIVEAARESGARAGQSIIETRGADGVLVDRSGHKFEIHTESVGVRDATGAGDTLAGEVLANLLSGTTDLEVAVRRGIEASRALLLRRVAGHSH